MSFAHDLFLGNYLHYKLRERIMEKGKVKWFNNKKGYGFIIPQESQNDKDVFVHISAVQKAGLMSLDEGQMLYYDRYDDRGRIAAGNLVVIS